MKKFETGGVYSTPGVNAKLEDSGTEADRSSTMILLPSEY